MSQTTPSPTPEETTFRNAVNKFELNNQRVDQWLTNDAATEVSLDGGATMLSLAGVIADIQSNAVVGNDGLPGRVIGIFFQESATEPSNPGVSANTAGTYITLNTPSGWSTTRPANPSNKVWMVIQSTQPDITQSSISDSISSGPIDITAEAANHGDDGLPGRQVAVFFRESATTPADPAVSENTSGSFVTINTPSGWSTTRPANPTEKVWMLIQQAQGNVANDAFTDTLSSGPIDITAGSDGLAGRVWRFFFRRSTTAIAAPAVVPFVTAGRVDIQTPSGWSTSIPIGTETLRWLAQSTQPNAANNGGENNLSFIIPLPSSSGGGGGGGVDVDNFNALVSLVGAIDDDADIDGTSVWHQLNQIKEWVGDPTNDADISDTGLWGRLNQVIEWFGAIPTGVFYYFVNTSTGNLSVNSNPPAVGIWKWLDRYSISIRNLLLKHIAQQTAINTLQAQVGAGTSSATNTSRTVADITQEDATQDQWSIGNIVGDLLTGVLNYVKGTPTPIDYTIRLSSTARTGGSLGPNESLIDGHWVFGFTRENVALPNIANTIPGSSLGEVAPTVTGDLGDDIDAVLNVTNHSLSSGYMLVAMKVDADYVPKNLRVRTSGGTETVNHTLQLSETTATHKIYVTDHSDELQWGDVFGISAEGNFTADIGFRDANNENYLQGNVVKSFAPFPLSKYTRTFFGAMKDIPRAEKPGDMYVADDGDILISKQILTGILGYFIYPIPTGNRYFGFSAETIGAISTFLAPATSGASFDIQKTITKLLYDSVNDEIVVDFNKKNQVVEGVRSLSVRAGQVDLTRISTRYRVINTPLVIKPEADSIGSHARYAGCKSPVNESTSGYKHPTITPAYSGTAATYFGASMNPIVGYKRTASGTSYGTSSDNNNWKTGDTIVVDRSMADRSVRITSRAESHTEIKGMVYGERLNFEEEGQRPVNENDPDTRRLHFRIPAANAAGELATPKGSRTNPEFNTGIFEVDLKFGEAGSFVHLPLPANYISGSQKLALFLKPITPGAAADFDKMDLATDRYYILTYHSSIHDYNTSSVPSANRYARHKWDLPSTAAAQLSAHFDADINGAMFVGIAIIEETGTGNNRALDDIVSSWLPVPYEQIYVDGVHIDLQLESFKQIRVGTTRSRMEVQYKTNSYTQAQRDKYYADSVPETEKDILVNGRAVAVNLKNREGMYHIPFDITHIKPFIKDEPFFISLTLSSSLIGLQTITKNELLDSNKSIAWDRVVRAETHSHNKTEDSTDITESRFEVFNREIEPDYTRQEKLAIDTVEDDYPSKYLAIPFDKGSMYERSSSSNANDMDDTDLISEKQSFAVDSDAIEGSVIIEDIYLNADNTGTNQITFRVGHDIANSSTVLPSTIIHHPLSGAKLTIPGVAASTVRATKAYQNGKRVFNVSSGANWDKAVTLVKDDKISIQLMGGQSHNNPQLVWHKLIT